MREITYTVREEDAGASVLSLLRRRLGVSAALVRRMKRTERGITLDGEHVTVCALARPWQLLRACWDEEEGSGVVVPTPGELDIVYEDELLLALNKPAGLPVHPSRGHYDDTLANRAAWLFRQRGEPFTFHAVNRIDSVTGGLVCIARDKYAAALLSQAMADGGVSRTYRAVVCGTGLPETGTVDLPIARCPGRGIMRQVDPAGQRAVTHYKRLAEGAGHTLLELELETGRTHQIRVHFSHLGYPVAGDFMYGQEREDFPGAALHSYRLRIALPGREPLELTVPEPEYFAKLITIG
ncbi:MAG: RluA family pseudouridine synthase [Clostridia bacterium]|nr:RluA family pseudouridine synthase [Clostridia bacterium]